MTIKKKKKISSPSGTAFNNTQLSLFQNFLSNTLEERDRLSNTIDFWDGVPKYFVSRQEMSRIRGNKEYLPTIERDFEYQGRFFKVRIRPARLTDKEGRDKEFYPSAREEIVEDALRRLTTKQNHGFLDKKHSGVVFTLYMLRRELKQRGHTLSYQEIIESLDTMIGSRIEIYAADGSADYKAPILVDLLRVNKDKYREDPKARWVAHFNPLVTRSIYALTYRQYDYHTMMSHSAQLSRWLHKRLAHNYTNANFMQPYSILYSTLKRDSGLLEYKDYRQGVYKLDKALGELQNHHVLTAFEKEVRRGARNKILDAIYILMPHPQFVQKVKAANKRQRDAAKD